MKPPLLIASLFLAVLLVFAGGSAVAADSRSELTTADRTSQVGAAIQIYWIDADTGTIRRANSDGSGTIEDLITSGHPTSLALDLAAGKLYWTDTAAGKIKWAHLNDLTNHHDLYSSERPTNLALDVVNNELYWTDQVPGSIQRADANGNSSSAEILVLEGEPTSLALDPANRDMYWTDGATGKIRRAQMDRSIPDPIDDLATALVWPDNLALDLAQRQMYWTEWAPGRVRRANMHGAGNPGIENLVRFTSGLPTGLVLDLPGGKMYWTNGVNHTIQSSDLTGTGFAVTNVFSASDGLKAPEGIALATILLSVPQLYWVDEEAQRVQRTAEEDGARTIEELELTTAKQRPVTLNMPGSIAVDPLAGKVYWTDDGAEGQSDGKIQRANLDGSQVENLFSGLRDPVGIALSLDAGQLYWADRFQGAIYRANLADISDAGLLTSHETLIVNLTKPYQIALDTASGHMYWTERGESTSKIRRADLDGQNITDIDFEYPLVAPENPFGLALDLLNDKMYWTERGTGLNGGDQIRRANLDGQNGEVVILAEPYSLSGITLDLAAGKIYWTDEVAGAIKRADLNGKNVQTVVTGLSAPEGMAMVAASHPDWLPLLALYRATDGENWTRRDGWLSDAPLYEWHGVTTGYELNEAQRRFIDATSDDKFDPDAVIFLQLGNNRLTGSIPEALANLDDLLWLYLNNNRLSGTIPAELADGLAALEVLDLSDNQLIGTIPAELRSLTNLTRLELDSNYLSGPIPPELGSLSNLKTLNLHGNELGYAFGCAHPGGCAAAEAIPSQLGNLSELIVLDLSSNDLVGEIPTQLGSLAGLEELNLSENLLSGGIPLELGNLDKLTYLNLSVNELGTGRLVSPTLPVSIDDIPASLAGLGELETLDLSRNRLNGRIPARLGSLSNLKHLDLSYNLLTWPIPEALGNLANLKELNLRSNQLFGGIPLELSNINHVACLGFPPHEYQPGGAIDNLGKLTSLQDLDLSNNKLSEQIPSSLCSLATLQNLNLSENQLSGPIPSELNVLNKLETLYLNDNDLTDPIPPELSELQSLRALYLNYNLFTECTPYQLRGVLNISGLGYSRWARDPLPDFCVNPRAIDDRNILVELYEKTKADMSVLKDELYYHLKHEEGLPPFVVQGKHRARYYTFTLTAKSDVTIALKGYHGNDVSFTLYLLEGEGAEGNVLHASGSNDDTYAKELQIKETLAAGSYTIEATTYRAMRIGHFQLTVNGLTQGGIVNHGDQSVDCIQSLDGDTNGYAHIATGGSGGFYSNCYSTRRGGNNELCTTCSIDQYDNPSLVLLNHRSVEERLIIEYLESVEDFLDVWLSRLDDLEEHGIEGGELRNWKTVSVNLGWTVDGNWLSERPIRTWYGVKTSTEGRVIELDLSDNNLRGDLPWDQLIQLDRLVRLDLGGNYLTGSIPHRSERSPWLENLKLLDLTDNELYGCVPTSLREILLLERVQPIPEEELDSHLEDTGLLDQLRSFATDGLFQAIVNGGAKAKFGEDNTEFGKGLFGASETVWEAIAGDVQQMDMGRLGLPPCPPDSPIPVSPQNVDTDRQALEALYEATGGLDGNWINSTNWNTNEPLGTWHGITTNGDGRVHAIDLSVNAPWWRSWSYQGNGLSGHIPEELGNLGQLMSLNLSRNDLKGKIPATLGNLSNLYELALNDNYLTNDPETGRPIPPELGNLGNLQKLYLHNNNLSGRISPHLGTISSANLRVMNIDRGEGELFGCLPPNPKWIRSASQLKLLTEAGITVASLGSSAVIAKIPAAVGKVTRWLRLERVVKKATVSAKTIIESAKGKVTSSVIIVRGHTKYVAWSNKVAEKILIPARNKVDMVADKVPDGDIFIRGTAFTTKTVAKNSAANVSSAATEKILQYFEEPVERSFFRYLLDPADALAESIESGTKPIFDAEIEMDKVWCAP